MEYEFEYCGNRIKVGLDVGGGFREYVERKATELNLPRQTVEYVVAMTLISRGAIAVMHRACRDEQGAWEFGVGLVFNDVLAKINQVEREGVQAA